MDAEQAKNQLEKIQSVYSVEFYYAAISRYIYRKTLANQNEVKLYRVFGDEEYHIAPMPTPIVMDALKDLFTDLGYQVNDSGDYKTIAWEFPSELPEPKEKGHAQKSIKSERSFDIKRYKLIKSICLDAIVIATLLSLLGSIFFLTSQASKSLERQTSPVIQYDSRPKMPHSSTGGHK